jgi:hypothetical protein
MRGILHSEDWGWSNTPRGGGSGGGGSQQTYQQVQLPAWVDQASQANYQQAQQVAARPYAANPSESIAPLSADQTQAIGEIQNLQGSADPTYQASINQAGGLLSSAAPITTGQLTSDAASLMNPYTTAVVNPTVTQMRQSLGKQLGTIGANAANVGAFGGSRQGIEEGTAIGQENLGEGQLVGGLLSSGYQQAMNQAQSLANTNLAAGQWATTAAPQLATQQATLDAQQAGLLGQVGGTEQQQAQEEADLAAQQWQQQWDYPETQLQILQSGLAGSPYGTTTIGQGPAASGGNAMGNVIGGLGVAASVAGIAL